MIVRCLNCINLDYESYPSHASKGYGRCKKETLSGVFESIPIERNCSKYQLADGKELIERIGWWDQINLFR